MHALKYVELIIVFFFILFTMKKRTCHVKQYSISVFRVTFTKIYLIKD